MTTFKEWLSKYGQDSCASCPHFNIPKCHCNYKGSRCTRYDAYVRDEKRERERALFDV